MVKILKKTILHFPKNRFFNFQQIDFSIFHKFQKIDFSIFLFLANSIPSWDALFYFDKQKQYRTEYLHVRSHMEGIRTKQRRIQRRFMKVCAQSSPRRFPKSATRPKSRSREVCAQTMEFCTHLNSRCYKTSLPWGWVGRSITVFLM